MFKTPLFALIAILFMFNPSEVHAKRFGNSYVSFDLPDNWDCHVKGVSWICSAIKKSTRIDAQIVLGAKEAGPQDSLTAFEQHLGQPKMIEGFIKGTTVKTNVQSTRRVKINNKMWVDSLHRSGEQEGYYTRYAASVHNGLAILVTFTIHKNVYPYYSQTMLSILKSINLNFNKNIVASNTNKTGVGKVKAGKLGQTFGSPSLSVSEESEFSSESSTSSDIITKIIGLLIIAGAAGWYVLKRKKS